MKIYILYAHHSIEDSDYTDMVICGCWTNVDEFVQHISTIVEDDIDGPWYEILVVEDGKPTEDYAEDYIISTFLEKHGIFAMKPMEAPTGKVFDLGIGFLKMMMICYSEQELVDFGYVGVIEYWGA